MEDISKLCEEKNFFAQKKCAYHLKSRILKFKKQHKCSTTKMQNVLNYSYIFKHHFLSENIAKKQKLLDSSKKLHVFWILNTQKVILVDSKNC